MEKIFTSFRGKDEFDEWHYGCAWVSEDGSKAAIIDDKQVFHSVISCTLTPYVNRVDKNGKQAFLGDIVRIKGCYADSGEEYDDIFQIKYSEDLSGFCLPDGDPLPDKDQFAEECEIIGNVYEDSLKFRSEIGKIWF